MKKPTKIILITIATIISCYCAFDLCVGRYQNKQATAIRYWCSDEQNVPTYNYIAYNGEEYYNLNVYYYKILEERDVPSFLPGSPYFHEEVNFNEFIYVKDNDSTFGATPFYKLNNDDNADVLFEKNNGVGGPSYGWYFYKKDYVFPTIKNTQVKELLLRCRNVDDYVIVNDREVIDKVIAGIETKSDISQLIPKDVYGDLISLNIRYEDSPLIEDVGTMKDGKFEYTDDIDEWMQNKRS